MTSTASRRRMLNGRELCLSGRAARVIDALLRDKGNSCDFGSLTEGDFLRLKWCGRKTLHELIQELARYGLFLQPDPPQARCPHCGRMFTIR
jgi:hypothetical protein